MATAKKKAASPSPSQVLAALAARSTASTFKAPTVAPLGNTMPVVKKSAGSDKIIPAKKAPGFDVWNFLGDIVDRPRRAVADTLQASMHDGETAAKIIGGTLTGNKKLVQQGQKEIPAAIGETLSAPIRGLFSTNKSDQRTTSDIIENETDRVNKFKASLTGTKYVNKKDDVNPVLKGVLGFVGDVATDPLTYVGIGALGKGVQTGLHAVKGGEGLAAGGKAVAHGLGEYTGVNALASGGKSVVKALTGAKPKLALEAGKGFVVDAKGEARRGVVQGAPAVEIPVVKPPKIKTEVPVEGGTKANPFEGKSISEQFRADQDRFKTVEKLLGQLNKAGQQSKPVVKMFKDQLANDKAGDIARALGPETTDALRAYSNPAHFNATIEKLHGIITDSGHLDTIKLEDEIASPGSAVGALFRDFGIDAAATNTPARLARAQEGNTVEGLIGRMATADEAARAATKAGRTAVIGELSGEQHVFDTLREVLPKQFTTADLAGGRVTASGARTTAAARGSEESHARFLDRLGTHPQWNVFQSLNRKAGALNDRLEKGSSKAGAALSAWKREQYMRDGATAENVLDQLGAPLHMDDGVNDPIAVSLTQLIGSMGKTSPEVQRAVDMGLFNGATPIAPTKLMEAAVAQQAGKTPQEVLGVLTDVAKRESSKKEAIPNFLSGGEKWGKVNYSAGRLPVDAPEGMRYVAGAKGGYYTEVSNRYLANRLLEGLQSSANEITGLDRANKAAYAARFQQEAMTLSDARKAALLESIEDPKRLAEAIMSLTRPEIAKGIGRDARATGARADSAAAAEELTVADLPDGVEANVTGAKRTASAAGRGDRAGAQEGRATAGAEQESLGAERARVVEDAIPEIGDTVRAEESFDITGKASREQTYRGVKARMMGFLDPIAKRFNASWAMEDQLPLYELQHEPLAVQQDYWGRIKPEIETLRTRYSVPLSVGGKRTVLQEALSASARGITSSDARVAEAQMVMDTQLSRVFDISQESPGLGSVFGRLGAPVEYLNAQFARYPGLEKFLIDGEKAAADKKAGLYRTEYEAGLDQWRAAVQRGDIDDPVAFLTSINHLALKATTHASVVDSLGTAMKAHNLMSDGPKTGYLVARFSKDSPLAAFWNPDWRVHPDMATGLQRVNEVMTEGTKLHGEHATFLEQYYDPIQRMWKFGMTLPRPGHHFRNLVGDASMTFLAEGTKGYVQSSRDAFKVLHASGSYTEMDFVKALESSATNAGHLYQGGGEAIVKTRFGNLDVDDVYKSLKDRGALPEYKHFEQLDDSGTSALSKFSAKVTTDNKLGQALGKISEVRDHWGRTQHYLQILQQFERKGYVEVGFMKKVRPRNMNELLDLATRRVQQFHPDGTRLARFEKNAVRRVIPFYSWMRGAIPAVVESGLRHPGRVTAINKASYNAAVAAGIQPDSLYDPFPTDQLFPSFLSQNVQGPQLKVNGHYWSVSPGFATWDLASTFANPQSGILGAVSPLIRTPIEVGSGHQLATGASIKDPSDYLDSNLPLVSNLANTTGVSPTGTVAGLLAGAGIDQQRKVRDGSKHSDDLLASLLSTMTGVQATDESRADFIKTAQNERKFGNKRLDKGQATGF